MYLHLQSKTNDISLLKWHRHHNLKHKLTHFWLTPHWIWSDPAYMTFQRCSLKRNCNHPKSWLGQKKDGKMDALFCFYNQAHFFINNFWEESIHETFLQLSNSSIEEKCFPWTQSASTELHFHPQRCACFIKSPEVFLIFFLHCVDTKTVREQ